jgi:Lon protease-like protein
MQLPLFALHAVLFPHLPMTLHVFEPRYRAMTADVVEDGSRFGGRLVVSMITRGPEVGGDADSQAVGTVAEVRSAERLADGRWWLSVVGDARVRLGSIDRGRPYPVVDATELSEPIGDGAQGLVPTVQAELDAYLATVKRFVVRATSGGEHVPETRPVTDSLDELLKPIHLPSDPVAASYAVAGVLQVELMRKQRLLELPDAASRLRAELALLRSETRLLGDGELPTVPAADLGYHPN